MNPFIRSALPLMALFLMLRILLMIFFPILGDEAYYVFWGTHVAGGYYDMPPMVGWWTAFFSHFSLQSVWLRLPNLLVTLIVSWGIFDLLKSVDRNKAFVIAALYFIAPIHYLAVLMTPDVPLLFFTFYAALLFYCADQRDQVEFNLKPKARWATSFATVVCYVFTGALWGAAFLSKYFAIALIPAILLWLFFSRKDFRSRSRACFNLLWVVCGAAPFVIQHVLWNQKNCYATFTFNFITRQSVTDGSHVLIIALFLVYIFLLSTPFLFFDAFRFKVFKQLNLNALVDSSSKLKSYALYLWLVPVCLFGLTALVGRGQGLHWYLSYTLFFFIWIGLCLTDAELRIRYRRMAMLTFSLLFLVGAVLSKPDLIFDRILKVRHVLDLMQASHGKEWVDHVAPWLQKTNAVMFESYSSASVADRHLRQYSAEYLQKKLAIGLWDPGSRFGRVFDFHFDPRNFDQKNILMLSGHPMHESEFAKYFESTESKKIEWRGTEFVINLGLGFKSKLYWDEKVLPRLNFFYPVACHLKNELKAD